MTAPKRPLVVTGASGFVGRAVVDLLRAQSGIDGVPRRVTLLVRNPSFPGEAEPLPPGWRVVACDLGAPLPGDAIEPGSVVLHLAAATGKLSSATMREVNVEGTRRVVDSAVTAQAAHFVLVSSIAAAFSDRRWYPYAEAKRDAEDIVSRSGIGHTIVRPTMVFGQGSPVQEGLERLALAGPPIVLGTGRVQLQPIDVDDLAAFLVALANDSATIDQPGAATTVEVGGSERLSLSALLNRMRLAHTMAPREPWGIPLWFPRRALAATEPILGGRLPITAGQLASFINDSTATPSALVGRLLPSPRPLTRMLLPGVPDSAPGHRDTVGHSAGESRDVLSREFGVWAAYLGSPAPGPWECDAYQRCHASAAHAGGDRLDQALVDLARRSPSWCALADSYARRARPYGTLRRKLVLALAVLESSPQLHADYDTARPSSAAAAWIAIGSLGLAWGFRTLLAAAVFLPVHFVARVRPGNGARG
jgi:NADH dehydrogenase